MTSNGKGLVAAYVAMNKVANKPDLLREEGWRDLFGLAKSIVSGVPKDFVETDSEWKERMDRTHFECRYVIRDRPTTNGNGV